MKKLNVSASLRKTVLAALMAALCCVATMVITIPTPLTGGFINLGDCFVLLSGWMLGAGYGFAAAGIGSALADILLGYAHYAPGTFVIKGLMALVAALIFAAGRNGSKQRSYLFRLLGAIAAEAIMIAGYFGYAGLILGKSWAVALTSVPDNAFQALIGIVASFALCGMIDLSASVRKAPEKEGGH